MTEPGRSLETPSVLSAGRLGSPTDDHASAERRIAETDRGSAFNMPPSLESSEGSDSYTVEHRNRRWRVIENDERCVASYANFAAAKGDADFRNWRDPRTDGSASRE